jgi:putative FmdB family regulatory protein
MPIYIYECAVCNESFKSRHEMSETCETCVSCGSTDIARKPSSFMNLSKERTVITKVGDLTKEFIENSKADLKGQIKEL